MARNLIVILGDQLSTQISSLRESSKKDDIVLMMEVEAEATYVPHHPHKIILIFSAMRHFCDELRENGFSVEYLKINDHKNKQSFTENLLQTVNKVKPKKIVITESGEYRVQIMIDSWAKKACCEVEQLVDDRFYCEIDEFAEWAKNKKSLLMENFYRSMRQKTGILMEDKRPVGGKFNYDVENRSPPKKGMTFPKRKTIQPDAITEEVIQLVKKRYPNHLGYAENFQLAVTRKDALKLLNHFIKHNLPTFGDYQDAMLIDEYYLHHSFISMYLNIGLLLPAEVVEKAEQAFLEGDVSINNAEGFIRQILGWREYIRGLYWLKMPEYKELNYFNAENALPSFYWDAKTDMKCLQQVIQQSLETATSHHIQRLMITGNFAMLLGVRPEEICDWYLAIYADAFEWVELPNTLGMSQFADGGLLATKPYAASGNYVNKMSNFCSNCQYQVKEKLTEKACPFNDLYWGFLLQNQSKLQSNPRLKFAFNHIAKMNHATKRQYKEKREKLIKSFCVPYKGSI